MRDFNQHYANFSYDLRGEQQFRLKTISITSVHSQLWYYMPDVSSPGIRLVLFFIPW